MATVCPQQTHHAPPPPPKLHQCTGLAASWVALWKGQNEGTRERERGRDEKEQGVVSPSLCGQALSLTTLSPAPHSPPSPCIAPPSASIPRSNPISLQTGQIPGLHHTLPDLGRTAALSQPTVPCKHSGSGRGESPQAI